MTEKERLLQVLKTKRSCGPAPVFPQIDVAYAAHFAGAGVGEAFADPKLHALALEGALRRHPDAPGVYVNLCLGRGTAVTTEQAGAQCRHMTDRAGVVWRVPDGDIGAPVRYAITDLDDPRLLEEDPLSEGICETFEAISKEVKESRLIVPGITGPYSQIVFLMGLTATLEAMVDEPEKLAEVIRAREKFAIQWAQRLKEAGAECIWIGEGAASSSLISPQCYRDFVLPSARAVVDAVREMGMLSIMHVCGNINPSFEVIAQAGADAMDIDYMVALPRLLETLGGTVCLKGNLDPVVLQTQEPQVVRALCRDILTAAGEEAGFILSTGCLVPRDAREENVEAMLHVGKGV